MEHIITADEFFNSGLPVSSDVTASEITFAVNTIEYYFIEPFLGDTLADILANPTQYQAVLNAGNGLKQMMYHLTFAFLLYDKIRLTRFSSVIKNDEHSTDPSMSDIKAVASMHWEIGYSFLRSCCDTLSIDYKNVQRNDLIFNESIY